MQGLVGVVFLVVILRALVATPRALRLRPVGRVGIEQRLVRLAICGGLLGGVAPGLASGSRLHLVSAILLALGLSPFVWPWPWLELLAIPLGSMRLARLYARLGNAPHPLEAAADWSLPAVRALLQRPTPARRAAFERALSRSYELPATAAAAQALLALCSGQRELARDVLELLCELPAGEVPGHVRRLAAEVCALEALVSARPLAAAHFAQLRPQSRLSRLVACLLQPRAAGLAWLLAPRRRHTRALLRAARQPLSAAKQPGPLAAYSALQQRPAGAVGQAELGAALAELDALHDAVLRAPPALEQPGPEALSHALFEPPVRELSRLLERTRLRIPSTVTWLVEIVAMRLAISRVGALHCAAS